MRVEGGKLRQVVLEDLEDDKGALLVICMDRGALWVWGVKFGLCFLGFKLGQERWVGGIGLRNTIRFRASGGGGGGGGVDLGIGA